MKNIPNISFKSWVDDEKETINLFSLAFGTHHGRDLFFTSIWGEMP